MGRRQAAENGVAPAEPVPEPFAREAKHFTEMKVLNREVRVNLEGVDRYENLFGSVLVPDDGQPTDLGQQLVKAGLAKVSIRKNRNEACAVDI